MTKIDVKWAYRRSTLASLLTAMIITKVDDVDLMILWMTFGRANGPFDWPEIITEPVTDLGNDLLNSNWDETKIHYPRVEKLSVQVLLPTSSTFGKALHLGAAVPFWRRVKADDFLENFSTAGCFNKNCKRLVGASLLVLHMFSRPIRSKELVPRDGMLSLSKLMSEGVSSETLTALG